MIKDNKMIKPEVNGNFHRAAGINIFNRSDSDYKEYRRKWKEWPSNYFVGEFPLFIDTEITSVCNLRCPFCANTSRRDKIKKGFMSFETFKKIIDEGSANGLYGVKFNIRGEPLLHPQIYQFVKYAKDNKLIDVYFNTNAMLLTKEASRKLIDAGLDRITISFEGYTKEVYERCRLGARFETVLSNISYLQSLKKEMGIEYPFLRVQTVMLPEIRPIFDKYKEFWAVRADEVAFLDYKDPGLKKKGIKYPWACPQLWQRMAVRWDGTILPCNEDDDAKLALGNIAETTIKEAWASQRLNQIRKMHKENLAHLIDACDGCYLRDSEIAKVEEK